jgi:carbon monoxide dehydrogenase subunit G
MQMSGEYRIEASRDAVWAALNDPEVLKQAIPGCEEIDKASDTEFAAKVKVKLGPVSAKFTGNVNLTDLDPPNGYTISGEGKGGPAGFARGGAKVRLEADGAATILHYEVDAQVGGKLAQIGSRLIDATAKKMAGDFFAGFAEVVGGPAPAEADDEVADALAADAALAPATGVRPLFWVLGLIAVVAALLSIFAGD